MNAHRCEVGINLIKDWALFVGTHGSAAKSIAEKLSPEDSQRLWDVEEITIPVKHERLVKKFFHRVGDPILDKEQIKESKEIRLTESQVHELRREAVTYLNMLEAILSARRHHVADEDIIKEQFLDLVVLSEGRSILSEFRKAAGGVSVFPSIEEFVRERAGELDSLQQGKEKL